MITVTELRKTSHAFPVLWEGVTSEGKFIGIYFRYDCLRVAVSDYPHESISLKSVLDGRAELVLFRDYALGPHEMNFTTVRNALFGLVEFELEVSCWL